MRESLGRLFRKRPDLSVVGQDSLTDSALTLANQAPCDILMMDRFPAASLSSVLDLDAEQATDARRTILIGMDEDEGKFLAAVRAGIAGYLLKDASAGEVVSAVRAVAQGDAVCPPRLCMCLFRSFARQATEGPAASSAAKPGLTLRQRQLVSLVAKGLTNKEIASHLNLSEFTVKNHLHRIMKQVDAGTRHEAVETILSLSGLPNA